ncbi:MAG: pullulanase [Ignavibacteria bacterium RBG_16_34_14]|nr:MAG: pullulanase [Ignavibacteria bacterium RBG_16_34_14]
MKLFGIIIVFIAFQFLTHNSEGIKLYSTKHTLTQKHIAYLKRLDELDKYYSDKKLGSFVEEGKTFFRLFVPNAEKVFLVTFNQPEDTNRSEYEMINDNNGVWEVSLDGEKYGLYYGYLVKHYGKKLDRNILCLDPYAKAVTTFNTYGNPRRAIVVKESNYDWEGDEWIQMNWRDLIIYEMHIRDMTMHPSSEVNQPGTYKGLIEENRRGGIDYVYGLGVNMVELLPAHEFANLEIPFNESFMERLNTWNPYEKNHWGYMTAAFFAPEAYYSESVKEIEWNKWQGKDAKSINDFKDMVKAFHKKGIGVMMDVVYNHLSEYETGNLKEIDKEYYFRLDSRGHYKSESGTGNDLRTERPMLRRMIIESILFWMKEYHIDGFRFDLGKLIDWKTIEEIIKEAKKVNPNVVFVCEPWGGGYDPAGFSLKGWGSWNDQIRNGVKGENPVNGLGWIFGKWYGNNDQGRIKSYVNGTLERDKYGLFQKPEHSVNYLESHDGYTLGDFIRIGTKEAVPHKVIKDIDKFVKLTSSQLKLNKLAALFLFTSQGITMIHSGQEFARTKVISQNNDVPDTMKGMIDHNSYNKDNETNYINYEHAKINEELFNYYKGLIELRNTYPAFRRAKYEEVSFYIIKDNDFALGFLIAFGGDEFLVLFNANPKKKEEFHLPEGEWDVLVNEDKAGIVVLDTVTKKVILKPSNGMVLKKR